MDQAALGHGISLLVKATAILAVAWGVTAVLRTRSAAVRHVVWSLALATLLVLPLLSVSMPAWRVPLPGLAEVDLRSSFLRVAEEDKTIVDVLPEDASVVAVQVTDASADMQEDASLLEEESEARHVPVGVYALAVWAAGAVLILAHLLFQTQRIRRFARAGVLPGPSSTEHLVASLARAFGIRRKVRLLRSTRVAMPVTWGVWQPVILLPEECVEWSDERLRMVLMHELAHVERFDYLAHLIAEAACASYWPNPLVWMARRRMRAEQEQACDDRVLGMGARSLAYAEHLLEIARGFQGSRWVLRGTIAMARDVGLKSRVRAILDGTTDRHPVSSWTGALIAAVFCMIAVPLAALRPGDAPQRETVSVVESATRVHSATMPIISDSTALEESHLLWIEAEDAVLSHPMRLEGDLSASGGRFIEVEDDHDSRGQAPADGRALYRFEVSRSGAYLVWGRVAVDDSDDSFWVRMDDGPWIRWNDIHEDRSWRWAPVHDSDRPAEPVRFDLAPGPHTFEVAYREDDVKLDRLLITDDMAYVPEGRGRSAVAAEAAYLWMEAEQSQLSAPMEVEGDPHASGGRYVWTPVRESRGEGAATFTFTVAEPGSYAVWGRALGPKGDQNSFFISLDSGREVVWDIPGRDPDRTAERWTWDPLGSRDEDGAYTDPIVYRLEAGTHTIRVRNRESGTRLDALLVTNDLSFEPRGAGPLLPPAQSFQIWIEAEDAPLPPSVRRGTDAEASGTEYVLVQSMQESMDAPPARGRLTYQFDVPQAGRYLIWGRVIAPDDGSDSFWVRVNGGAWVRWNGIRESNRWRWDHVHDADYGEETVQFELTAGLQTLEIAHRENDIRLDRLLVTNDPTYKPKGAGPGAR